ncbi:MAG TPA: rhomboid family intramembrane serine protease [Tepidisphaeraceae bacterium]|nr:rhomboid family intramembrane serine protease [Tepidisphaeraceae bacterium]
MNAPPPPRMGNMQPLSVVTWLVIINIAVFILDHFLFAGPMQQEVGPDGAVHRFRGESPLFWWGYFSSDTAFNHFQLWRVLTFQFLHADASHIIGNLLGLYFMGPMVEQSLGRRRFLAFYLLCGVAGPIAYMGMNAVGVLDGGAGALLSGSQTPLIGASAGVFGVLVAAAVIAPRVMVQLIFPPIPMQLRTLALGLLALATITVFTNGHNAGGEAAHLGGAAMGFLLIRQPRLLDWIENKTKRSPRMRITWR